MQGAGRGRGSDPFGETIEPEELAFVDEDERLPWLEADDDFDENEVDTGRVVVFVLAGFLLLGLIIAGLWLYFRDQSGSAAIADGSTIEAPDEPYKSRPENPGGAEAMGTGATSFAVAEGQTREGRVAVDEPVRAAPDAEDAAAEAGGEKTVAPGIGVQVGAYSSRERAQAGWATLTRRFTALDGVRHRIVEGTLDGSAIFRLQAVAGDLQSAHELCDNLRASGGDCQVKN